MQFKKERFKDTWSELVPLFPRHWAEIALDQDLVPLAMDKYKYMQLEQMNLLHLMTARENGKLVGYAIFFVSPHLHYMSTLHAVCDMFWLDPAHRRGWNGVRLLKAAEKMCWELGAETVKIQHKLHHDLSTVFKRMGYKPIETLWSKRKG